MKGEAALLLRQLERRFGALPAEVRDRVATADTAALEAWGLRVLDAGSLDDVLRSVDRSPCSGSPPRGATGNRGEIWPRTRNLNDYDAVMPTARTLTPMSSITILDPAIKERLRIFAAEHGLPQRPKPGASCS